MELNQLRGFVTVARLGSFTRAAEALFLSQPAMSLQVKALEKALGEPLFERRGRTLLLTPAGRVLLERAEKILDLVKQVGAEVQALKGLEGGRLVIGTSDSNCLYVLPDLVQLFRSHFPKVELHLTNSQSSRVAELVATGQVDFGLVTLPVMDARIESRPLFRRDDVLICAPEHPLHARSSVTLQELGEYPLLLLDQSSRSRNALDQVLADAGVIPKSVMELGSIEVIKRYVEIDLGISIVPDFTVKAEVQSGRLCTVPVDHLPDSLVGVIQRCNGYLSPAAQTFLGLLEQHVAAW
jgi:DNA-binding transcriptional LysR family regulator